MHITKQQEEIIQSPMDKVVVSAAAGSGKTFILIERVRWIIQQGIDPSKIVCITFTNNAADEMRERLGDDYKEDMFIGTIHAYANRLLVKNGIGTATIRRENNFDKLFALVSTHPEAVEEVDFLALDEAQDSSEYQFDFIFTMIQPKRFFVVGDVRQSIFGFNNARPEFFMSLMNDIEVTPYTLTLNHRNAVNILNYSNWIVNKMKKKPDEIIIGASFSEGLVDNVRRSDIIKLLKRASKNSYGEWVILCRSNSMIHQLIGLLTINGIPTETFKQGDNNLIELEEKMNSNKVKVLTIHSAKGLEWDNVIVAEQVWKTQEDLRLMYVAATRAKQKLYMCR